MKESQFIERNKDKWKNFEFLLDAGDKNPRNLKEQFIQVTDDLSYSRTFYKNRSVRVYLNLLSQRVYNNLFKNKPNHLKEIKSFFVDEVQQIAYQSRWILLLSFIVAMLGFGIGWLTTSFDPEFPSSFFGSQYVEITKENIKKGDPLGIYKFGSSIQGFFMIGFNNLRVAILIFVCGLFFSFGAMVITFYNGIMVGVFMCFFYQYGVVKEFHLTVWMHGTIEMLTMIVECAAGVLLGKAFLFPGTFTRSKAFFINARKGSLLLLSTIPLIVFAAFIEGYITRYNTIPDVIRLLFILGCLAFMLGYYVIIPYRKYSREGNALIKDAGEENLQQEQVLTIDSENIKTIGKIFYESLKLITDHIGKWIGWVLAGAALLTTGIYFLMFEKVLDKFLIFSSGSQLDLVSNGGAIFENMPLLLSAKGSWWGIVLAIWFALLSLRIRKTVYANAHGIYSEKFLSGKKWFLKVFVFTAILLSLPFFSNPALNWMVFLTLPLFLLLLFKHLTLPQKPLEFKKTWGVAAGKSYLHFMFVILLLLISSFFILSPFFSMCLSLVQWVIKFQNDTYDITIKLIFIFLSYTIIGIAISILQTGLVLLSWSANETIHAAGLRKDIQQVGEKPKIFGLETE